MALEKILTDGSETGLTAAEKINLGFDQTDENTEALNGTQVISEDIVKTVGVGKDFETLDLALKWVENTTQTSRFIAIIIDDGTHVLGTNGTLGSYDYAYYSLSFKNIVLRSASRIKENCIITLDPFDDGDQWGYIFSAYESYVSIQNITVDTAIGGYPYPNNIEIFDAYNSQIKFSTCTIKHAMTYAQNSEVTHNETIFDGMDSSIYLVSGSFLYTYNSTYQNITGYGIAISYSNSYIRNGITFINNASDINIPLNEIQFDGSYISDNTVPLQQKGLEAITDSMVITVGTGKDFELLSDALKYAGTIFTTGSGTITLNLDDGTHVIARDSDWIDWLSSYYYYSTTILTISSVSGNKENCIITLDPNGGTHQYKTIFTIENSRFSFQNVTIDASLGGNTETNGITFFIADSLGYLTVLNSTITNVAYPIQGFKGSFIRLVNSTISNGADGAIYLVNAEATLTHGCVLQDCDIALYIETNSTVTLVGAQTFAGNNQDTNILLNQIQYDGSYITDGTGPLSFKA